MGRAAAIVSVGILLSRVLGVVREAVIAALLGTGPGADIYFAAFTIPDILFYLMAGGYLSITFIPILSRHVADGEPDEQWRSFSAIAKPLTIVMASLTVLSVTFADQLVDFVFLTVPELLGSDSTLSLDAAQLDEVAYLTRIVLPAQIFFMLGSLLAAVQYTHKRFTVPSLAPLIYNLSIISGGVISFAMGNEGPAGFAWGALTGAIVGNFGMQLWGARRVGLRWVSGTSWRMPVVRQYWLLALPLMLGQSIAVLDAQLIPVFGQTLGESAISQLSFGRRLNMFPVGIIAQAAGVAAYPFLASLAEAGKQHELAETLTKALRYTIFAGFAATAAVVAAAHPAVVVAYERGSFTAGDSRATASVLSILALSIPAWGAHQVYSRGFYAQRRMWVPVGIGTAWTVVGAALYWWLAETQGTNGVALASVVAIIGYTISLAVAWHRQSTGARAVLTTVARSAFAAVVGGGAAWFMLDRMNANADLAFGRSLIQLAVAAVVVAVAYVGTSRLLGGQEFSELGLGRRLRR